MAFVLRLSSLLLLLLLNLSLTTAAIIPNKILFDAIYQFGDSIADTGNRMRINASSTHCSKLPYGETFFHRPTGRCSNGRLMIDFIANSFGLEFINPYLDSSSDFSNGVDFAVAGATALDSSFYEANNISTNCNESVAVQLQWFRAYMDSVSLSSSSSPGFDGGFRYLGHTIDVIRFDNSLFFMGEVGGNDIGFSFTDGKSFEFVYGLIPLIIQTIKTAVQEIIAQGATYIVVPGNFPIGCMPVFLWLVETNDTSKYDDMNCYKEFNEVARFQNDLLQQAIKELQQQHPDVFIAYGDYYNGYLWLLQNAASFGFNEDEVLNPCCGERGIVCGNVAAPLCQNPSTRISWDGTHPTQEANRHLAKWLLSTIFKEVSSH